MASIDQFQICLREEYCIDSLIDNRRDNDQSDHVAQSATPGTLNTEVVGNRNLNIKHDIAQLQMILSK